MPMRNIFFFLFFLKEMKRRGGDFENLFLMVGAEALQVANRGKGGYPHVSSKVLNQMR